MTRTIIAPTPVRWTHRANRIGRALAWLVALVLLGCAGYVISLIIGVLILLYAWPLPLS